MNIKIEELRLHPDCIEIVSGWMHSEWGNNNTKYWDSWIRSSLCDKDIPKTYIAFVDGELAGTCSLWRCDLQSRQDLFPWFGGLYVSNSYRGRIYGDTKLGILLQAHALNELKKLHYSEVYLFTEKSPRYYIRNGWEYLCKAPDENDQIVSICKKYIKL